jgi:K+-transporting ATPase KdpF subunit
MDSGPCFRQRKGIGAMEDLLVGIVAVGLIVYLFAALLKPEKF